MKVYAVTDLEGVAGVYQWENRDDAGYENMERRERQRRWLAEECNAMADGFSTAALPMSGSTTGTGPATP